MLMLLYIFYRVTYFHNELGITRLIYGTTPPPFYIRLYCCESTGGYSYKYRMDCKICTGDPLPAQISLAHSSKASYSQPIIFLLFTFGYIVVNQPVAASKCTAWSAEYVIAHKISTIIKRTVDFGKKMCNQSFPRSLCNLAPKML